MLNYGFSMITFYFVISDLFFKIQIQRALVDNRMIPCINARPYVSTELLMTLPDLVMSFFPNTPVIAVQKILQDVLNVNLYQGNR